MYTMQLSAACHTLIYIAASFSKASSSELRNQCVEFANASTNPH